MENKALVQILFGTFKSLAPTTLSPVRLFGSHQLSSLKLQISAKPNSEHIPHSVILPLKEPQLFSFMTSNLEDFSLHFEVYPTYGTKATAKATTLPSIFKQVISASWSGAGEFEKCVCPLYDSNMQVVGQLEFEMCFVGPFSHPNVQIGGKVETYWKSTTVSVFFFVCNLCQI